MDRSPSTLDEISITTGLKPRLTCTVQEACTRRQEDYQINFFRVTLIKTVLFFKWRFIK